MLGDLLYDRRPEAKAILYGLTQKAEELAEKLEEDYNDCARTLRDSQSEPNPVWRLAEALTTLQGRTSTQENVVSTFDSALLVDRPNGLSLKRLVTRNTVLPGAKRRHEMRSLAFTDAVLDYLVHSQILPSGNVRGARLLSLKRFLRNFTIVPDSASTHLRPE